MRKLLLLAVVAVVIIAILFFVFREELGFLPTPLKEYVEMQKIWKSEGISVDVPHENFEALLDFDTGSINSSKEQVLSFSERSSLQEIKLLGAYYGSLFNTAIKIKEVKELSERIAESSETACNLIPQYTQLNDLSEELENSTAQTASKASEFIESFPEFAEEINLNEIDPNYQSFGEILALQIASLDSIKPLCEVAQ